MTIRRQYQLPNCSLILDGLSIDPSPGSENVMSLLVNAECRISGLERSLNGGYNFFAALVRAVSQYGQEVLSGFAHPQVVEGEPLLVHINPGEGPYHHLVVQPEIADLGEGGDGRAIDIKLSAVQLFDLTEAVDQFFADRQTLPELEPALSPLARRFVRNDEPLSDRAVPAVLGLGGLVAATMALGLLPVPEFRDPTVETGERVESVAPAGEDSDTAGLPSGDLGDSEDPDTEIAAVPLDEAIDEAAAAEAEAVSDDSAERGALEGEIEETADSDLDESAVTDDDGEPEGESDSQPGEDEGGDLDVEPEGDLDNDTAAQNSEEFATYDEFKPADSESRDRPETDAEVTVGNRTIVFEDEPPSVPSGFADVRGLNSQLKQSIVENRDQPRFGDAISYRVRVSDDGTVIGYQPTDDSASSAIDETPLPKLVGEAVDDASSTVDYRVVFTERGVVEVSPWYGWSYYE